MNLRTTLRLISLATLCWLATTAAAADLKGNVGATTNYVFRGFTQSDNGPAIQGGVDYTHNSGFYAGAWASTVKFCNGGCDSGLEADLYFGISFKLQNELVFDLGYIAYEYSNSNLDSAREIYLGARYQGFSLTYYDGNDTADYSYLDFKVKVELPEQTYFIGHYGIRNNKSGNDVNDVSLGVAKELWKIDFALTASSEDSTDKTKLYLTGTKRFDIK
jgi:uncharacterized protein (TIGR02001 family)